MPDADWIIAFTIVVLGATVVYLVTRCSDK